MSVEVAVRAVASTSPEREKTMSLRNIMIELVDDFFAKGDEATGRKSWIEARVYHDAGNALLEKLGMPPREVGNGSTDQG